MINSTRRCVARFALGTWFAFGFLTPTPARASGNAESPRIISGDFTRMHGQWMTRQKSAELALPGGGRVRVRENTEASIMTTPHGVALIPGKKTPTYAVILRRGIVEIEIPEAGRSGIAIAVGTPNDARIMTLSGKSAVRVVGRDFAATSYSGVTTVSLGPKTARLPNGVVRQYKGSGSVVDRPILEATPAVGGRRVWLAPPSEPAQVAGYVWSAVPGASGYRVALRREASSDVLAEVFTDTPVMESCAKPLEPGRYELRISAVDSDGFASRTSTTVPIAVVGVELPGGAVALPRDTIQLAREQRVRLTHAEGLTLTTADHRVNVPASQPFGLEGLDRAVVLIHPKGGGDSAPLRLVRRELSVSTWVGPKLATWPDDPIELQVDFIDGYGRPTPRDVEATIHVFVGTELVDVTWNKQGSLWQARLPPSSKKGQGPWVVRLEVLDQHGNIIGRDFAEITKTRRPAKFLKLQATDSAVAGTFIQ